MNPGYILVDCSGIDLTSTETQTKTGIFNAVDRAYNVGKACFGTSLVYGALGEMSPVPLMINPDGVGGYFATSSILQVHVYANDTVTVTSLVTE